jgi:hypothetical protein
MVEFLKQHWSTEGPLGFPMQDKQARALEALVKELPQSKEYKYRQRVMAKAPTELNPGERSDVSWISTESVDRTQEVVISKGMNNAQFIANPLVTLGHSYCIPPVGRSLWQKRVKDGDTVGIKAKTQYPPMPGDWPESDPWLPDKVFLLVQAGLMQGKSIGFLPTKVHFADAGEAKKNGWPEGALVFDEWLLLEYACCFLPVNQDALVQEVSKGLVLPAEVLKAMGLEGVALKAPVGVEKGLVSRQDGILPHTTLSEVERVVSTHLAGIDWKALTERAVRDSLDRARGKV